MTSAALRIDPRLRARRIEVRRAEGRRRLRFLAVGVGVGALIVGAWAVSRSALLDLDHIRVDGVGTASSERVHEAIRPGKGTPLMDLDLRSIETEVAALPWVKAVEASREWPGTLRLDVVERVPVAALPAGDGSFVLVDDSGVAMATAAGSGAVSLPVIASAAVGQLGTVQSRSVAALGVVEVMTDDLRNWIETITISGSEAEVQLGFNLVGGAVVDLGAGVLLPDKLSALRAVLAGADLRCIEVIDVRMADLTTITRDAVCDAALAGVGDGVAEDAG